MLIICILCNVTSYNAMERREACKGGKEIGKKHPPAVSKSTGVVTKPHSSHVNRKNEAASGTTTAQSNKGSRPNSSGGPAYDEQVLTAIIGCIIFSVQDTMGRY